MVLASDSMSARIAWDAEDRLTLPDGGTVSVQWAGLDAPDGTPIIVLLPTIMGSGEDLRRVITALRRATGGWVVAVCNRRGHGDLPLTSPRINTMGSTADLVRQLEVIESRHPSAALYGVGISAGSGLLVRYLGEQGSASKLRAGVAHCPGYDISQAFGSVHPFYDRVMARRLVNFFIRRRASVWDGIEGVAECAQSRSMAEFHDRQYPLAGYGSRDTYYEHSNPMIGVDDIQTPLLVINAEDDPVCAVSNVYAQLDRMQRRSRLVLALTTHGGHCGFFDGPLARGAWANRLLGEFVRSVHHRAA